MIFEFKNKKIYYEISGNGPAVVLLHGFLESSHIWKKLLPFLEKSHTVLQIDFPGLGKSETVGEIHSMELMAEIVRNLMDSLQIETAAFIGHSMGGYITLAFIEAYPDRAEKIILLNSTFKADNEERKSIRDRSIRLMEQNPRAYVSMAIGNWAVESSRERFKEEIDELKTRAFNFPVDGVIAAIKGMKIRKDRSEVLEDFPKEKYLLLAEADPIIPAEETKTAAENLGVKVKIIAGGHMSLIENFEGVMEFLKGII